MNKDIIMEVIRSGALELRDVPEQVTNSEVDKLPYDRQPFLYASGNWGPGYVSIKGLVTKTQLFIDLARDLATKLQSSGVIRRLDFIAGNATGGMILGWILSQFLHLPYVYVRESRKKGGQKESVTGAKYLTEHASSLVVEELVNFAESTCNSANYLRELGLVADHAACILFYDNPEAVKRLQREKIQIHYLFTLSDLLDTAEQFYDKRLVQNYKLFLANPLDWQIKRGLTRIEKGGTL